MRMTSGLSADQSFEIDLARGVERRGYLIDAGIQPLRARAARCACMVVATSLSAPPSISTMALFACQGSATRVTCVRERHDPARRVGDLPRLAPERATGAPRPIAGQRRLASNASSARRRSPRRVRSGPTRHQKSMLADARTVRGEPKCAEQAAGVGAGEIAGPDGGPVVAVGDVVHRQAPGDRLAEQIRRM